MAIEKQPDLGTGDAANQGDSRELSDEADFWFRQFYKVFELEFLKSASKLPHSPQLLDYPLAALRAFKQTLLDSGISQEEFIHLLGQIALEDNPVYPEHSWNAELNQRRFELIDKDIQGMLTSTEHLELASLTQLMRKQVDTEENLPLEGARKLHQRLSGLGTESKECDS